MSIPFGLTPHSFGSKRSAEVQLSHQCMQRGFKNLAEKNNCQITLRNNDTYVFRAVKAGYILHPKSDRLAGCFVPRSFNIEKISSDDTPQTREALSKVFCQIIYPEYVTQKQ